MTRRGVRKYVDDLLAGRRPASFPADDFDAAQIRTAIELRAAEPGADEPRPEFVDGLKSRIAHQPSPGALRGAAPPHQRRPAARQQGLAASAAGPTDAGPASWRGHPADGPGGPAERDEENESRVHQDG
ncbi:hypothetical protein ABFW11_21625, partial [Mycolicibacterium porcinum]